MLAIGLHTCKRFMLKMLTWESIGSLVWKAGESDVESRDLQGGSPHLCHLRIDRLAPASKYWTYWSHARDMAPVNQCSLSSIDVGFSRLLQWMFREIIWERPVDRSTNVLCIRTGDLSLESSESVQIYWVSVKCYHVRGLSIRSVSGLTWEVCVPCVSNFSYKMCIDSNCHDSRIYVTACLVVVSI
jgi:hypothetical protein